MGRAAAWALMGLILVVTLFPFFWALRTAFSTTGALFSGEQSVLPVQPTTINVERAIGLEPLTAGGAVFDFPVLLRNTVIVATVVTFGQVTFSAMAAYAFARLRWPGRDKVFFLFLTGLMIPPIFTLIPNFVLIKDLGWLNSLPGIIAPFFLMTPFAVFFLRQFFLGINRALEEAALIDGAGHFRTFFRIIVPVSAGPLFTIAILTYIQTWNEFLWPFIVARDPGSHVFTVALQFFTAQTPGSSPDWGGLMSGAMIAALPILILFALMSRRVVDSIQFSGIK